MQSSPYGWLMLAGLAVSVVIWARLARRDDRLLLVYVAALVGAFLGAKAAYLLAEGWRDFGQRDVWLRLATGKSILGALPGGYVAVELAKKWTGYRGVTGDWFALVAPVGIAIGRVGCWLHGCCLGRACGESWFTLSDAAGVARWPAVPVEIVFNLAMVAVFLLVRRSDRRHTSVDLSKAANADLLPLPATCPPIGRRGHERGEGRGEGNSRKNEPPLPGPLLHRREEREEINRPSAGPSLVSTAADRWRGQHFHIYLMSYGLFRFAHEFLRDTPRLGAGISGYQFIALAVAAFGAVAFACRARAGQRPQCS